MFRESYKNAMNDIETNKELLDSLLAQADAVNIPKNIQKKKITFQKSRIYTLSGIAAAAAVMIVSINAIEFSNRIKDNSSENNSAYEITENKQENYNASEQQPETETNEPDLTYKSESLKNSKGNTEQQSEKTIAETPKPDVQPKSEESAISEPISEKEAESAAANATEMTDMAEAESKEPESKEAAKASSGDASVREYLNEDSEDKMPMVRSAVFNTETEKWTKAEYSEYIGINIERDAQIPSDMKNQTEDAVYIVKDAESGEIKNDFFNFYFTGENDRYLNITTLKTESSDSDWIKTVSDTNYMSAQSVRNGVQIGIECYMMTEDEQNALMDSLNN